MRRIAAFVVAGGLVLVGCTTGTPEATDSTSPTTPLDSESTSSTTSRIEVVDSSTTGAPDSGEPLFESTLRPSEFITSVPLPAHDSSAHPAFVRAFDAESGAEEWRVEVPFPESPQLTLAGDRLIYSFETPGDSDFIGAVGLDGELLWQATTTWRILGDLYIGHDVLVGRAFPRDESATTGAVFALSLDTGSLLWSVRREPWVEGVGGGEGLAFVAGPGGWLTAMEIDTGEQVWQTKVSESLSGSPHYEGGRLVVSTVRGLAAVNAEDGEVLWSKTTDGRRVGEPKGVAGGNAVSWLESDVDVGFRIAAFGTLDGEVGWTATSLRQFEVGTDVVVGFSGDEGDNVPRGVKVWNGADGELIANVGVDGRINPFSVVIADSVVYVGTEMGEEPGRLVAVSLATGEPLWTAGGRGSVGAPAVATDALFVPGDGRPHAFRGALTKVDPTTGTLIWIFDTLMDVRTQPIVVDGAVFVVSAERILRPID